MPPLPISPLVLIEEIRSLSWVATRAAEFASQASFASKRLDRALRGSDEVWICGCGDSYHAALAMREHGERISGKRWIALPAWEASLRLASYPHTDRVTLIAVSASGRTEATLAAVRRGRSAGALTIGITNRDQAQLSLVSALSLVIPVEDRPHAPRIAPFIANTIGIIAVADALRDSGGSAGSSSLEANLNDLCGTVALADDLAFVRKAVETWVRPNLGGVVNTAWLGSGPNFGSAMFACAKTMEAGGFFSIAEDVEEWLHVQRFATSKSVMTFVDAGTGLMPGRAHAVATLLTALGFPVLTISHEAQPITGEGDYPTLYTGMGRRGFSQIASAIVGASLAAHISTEAGRRAGQTGSPEFWAAHTPEIKQLIKRSGYGPA